MTCAPDKASVPDTIERAYRVRLYPKPEQAQVLWRLFGARRYVWNWALRTKDAAWRADGTKLTGIDLSRQFTQMRKAPDTSWLSALPREPFNQTLRDFDTARRNFFAGRAKRPRRRKFGTVHSARFTLDQRRELVDRSVGRVQLDGIGRVKFRVTEMITGRLRSITVSRDSAGRWFGSLTADGIAAPATQVPSRATLGVDLGLKDTAALSSGTKAPAPKYLCAHQRRLRRYQRHYVRQRDAAARRMGLDPGKPLPKGTRIEVSKRMRRTKYRIGTLHARIADCRRDHQHRLTARLVAGAHVICIEDLTVRAMSRGIRRGAFRRSVSDAGLGEIRRQLTYKANWFGRTLGVVDRFYPSSKTCSACGAINAGLALKDRHWACPACHTEHDRDLNAAKNIEREGLRLLATGSGGDAGRTPRSGETKARAEHACAAIRTPIAGQPSSSNREPVYRAAQRRPTRRLRDGPKRSVEG